MVCISTTVNIYLFPRALDLSPVRLGNITSWYIQCHEMQCAKIQIQLSTDVSVLSSYITACFNMANKSTS